MSARRVSDDEMSCSGFPFETVEEIESFDPFDSFPLSGEATVTARYLDLSGAVREPGATSNEMLPPRPRSGRLIIASATETEPTP